MSFQVDTGRAPIRAVSAAVEDSQCLRIRTRQQAITAFNRIRDAIEAHEDQHELDAYMARETLMLDALHLFDAHVAAEIRDIYETHRAALLHGGVNRIVSDDPRRPDAGTAQTARQGQDGKAKDWFDEL